MTTFKSVSMNEGITLMKQDKDFILLDVRRPEEYAAGHIGTDLCLETASFFINFP